MSNKDIAINWAAETINKTTGFIYSDEFFMPFNNKTRKKIIDDLNDKNIVVWPDPKYGAFLFKKGDPRLTMKTSGKVKVGAWIEDDSVLILNALAA